MRLYLAQSIPDAKNIHMQRKLESSFSKWLRLENTMPPKPTNDIPFVNHFSFNPELKLKEKLKLSIGFKETGTHVTELQLSAFVPVDAVKAPAGTTHIEFCISGVALRLGDDGYYGSHSSTITMAYNNILQDARQIAIPVQTQPGNILIAALQLRYGVQEASVINYRKFAAKHVAGIVGAVYL